MKTIHPRLLLLACLAVLPAAGTLHAQTTTWTGNGGTALPAWDVATNWTAGSPANGGSVVFGAASQTTSVDNYSSLVLGSATFTSAAPAYDVLLLGGNSTSAGVVLQFTGAGIVNPFSQTQTFGVSATPAANPGATLLFANSATISGNVLIDNIGVGLTGGVVGGGGLTQFTNSATAGGATIFNSSATTAPSTTAGAALPEGVTAFHNTFGAASAQIGNQGANVNGAPGGATVFFDTATAGNALITNAGGSASGALGGTTQFTNNSTAAGASIVNGGGTVAGASGGVTYLTNNATVGTAHIDNQAGTVSGAQGGVTVFTNSTTAGSATLSVEGGATGGTTSGAVVFENFSDGGTARMVFNAGGTLDLSALTNTGMNLGSIEGTASYVTSGGQTITGAGAIYLGSERLSVGGNNLSTTYNGSINDGGTTGGTGGSLVKTGTGILTLTGASTYTGGTTVNGGVLLANNTTGSATGTGAVAVQSGAIFGGTGTVAGNVVVAAGGTLFPGVVTGNGGIAGALTVGGSVGLSTNGTLSTFLGGTAAGTGYGQVRFGGTLTLAGTLSVSVVNQFALTPGMTFTILEGTGTGTVSGTFSNTTLAGTHYTDAYGDTFLVNYAANTDGGTVPNDVTLTVLTANAVPEPGTWALVGMGAFGLGFATRRRFRACRV